MIWWSPVLLGGYAPSPWLPPLRRTASPKMFTMHTHLLVSVPTSRCSSSKRPLAVEAWILEYWPMDRGGQGHSSGLLKGIHLLFLTQMEILCCFVTAFFFLPCKLSSSLLLSPAPFLCRISDCKLYRVGLCPVFCSLWSANWCCCCCFFTNLLKQFTI